VNRRIAFLAFLMMFSLLSAAAISAGQPGTTETVFNKKFRNCLGNAKAWSNNTGNGP
jgi:hypothetical protein